MSKHTNQRRVTPTARVMAPFKRYVRERLIRLIDDRTKRLMDDRKPLIDQQLMDIARVSNEASRLAQENSKAIEWILHENMMVKRDLGWLVESEGDEGKMEV